VFVAVERNLQPERKFFQNFAPQFPEKEVRNCLPLRCPAFLEGRGLLSTVGSLSISVTGVSMWIRMSAEVKKEIQLEIAKVNAQDTSAEPKPDLPLEIAHVLLIDVVGYSRLLVNEQIELLQELNQIVRGTDELGAAGRRP
jgi:hypothetical protein